MAAARRPRKPAPAPKTPEPLTGDAIPAETIAAARAAGMSRVVAVSRPQPGAAPAAFPTPIKARQRTVSVNEEGKIVVVDPDGVSSAVEMGKQTSPKRSGTYLEAMLEAERNLKRPGHAVRTNIDETGRVHIATIS